LIHVLTANAWKAVIRLSKKYLPGMAISYQHPKVKVHIGDGFKFLDDYKNEFDVIITDSSDPEGPAESLFQKPYFELLFGALKEGGVISTQGCTFSLVVCICCHACIFSPSGHHVYLLLAFLDLFSYLCVLRLRFLAIAPFAASS
jgi:predicted membrane-bound spermidine synthase